METLSVMLHPYVCFPRLRGVVVRALLAVSLCLSATMAMAVDEHVDRSESEVKAAFIYKFLGFVDWPARAFSSPTAPLVIGIVTPDDVATYLQQLVPGHTVQGRPVVVRNLKTGDSLEGLQVLYIGRADAGKLEELTARAQELSILTVSDVGDGIDNGCVINFLLDEGRVRFDVSVEAAQSSKLALSSRLLAVAHRVKAGSK